MLAAAAHRLAPSGATVAVDEHVGMLGGERAYRIKILERDRVDQVARGDESRPADRVVTARENELCVGEASCRRVETLRMMVGEVGDGGRIAALESAKQIFRLVPELPEVRPSRKRAERA